MPPTVPTTPDGALLVASWYPSLEDPIAGRFVADQAAALLATGRVRPVVVSFDPAMLAGAGRWRTRMARTVSDLAARAILTGDDIFIRGAPLVPAGIPVARLAIPGARDPGAGILHAALAREQALLALAERLQRSVPAAGGARPDLPDPFVVHAHTVYPDGVAAMALAQRLGLPLVITEHASFVGRLIESPPIRARYVAAVAFARRFIVVSQALADEITAALPEVAANVTVLPNAVDLDAFHLPRAGERRFDELLFVGYRKESKGLGTLLAALAQVRERRPATTLRLIGRSPSEAIEQGWHETALRYGVADAVSFDPPADRAGVARAMAAATLFVHPSPRETFGIVAVEALASGLPVVAADSGGVTEIMGAHPERYGAVVAPGDPAALAAGILACLERREAFDPEVLRAAAAERFGSATIARRLLELYGSPVPPRARRGATAIGEGDVVPTGPTVAGALRVLVALDPARLAAVARLPVADRAGLVLVTSGGAIDLPHDVGGLVVARLRGGARAVADAAPGGSGGPRWRFYRALRHPLAFARARGILPGLELSLMTAGAAAVRQALIIARGAPTAVAEPARPPEVVCLDGIDYLAAAGVLASGEARLAPGGLAWLGDRTGARQ